MNRSRSERLKDTRIKLGLTHKGLAKRTGLSHTTLEKLQSDETAWLTIKKETSEKLEAFYDSLVNESNEYINTESSEIVKTPPVVVTNINNVTSKDDKTLTLIEFVYEGLNESKTHKEFMANIQMLKRIVNNY